ncbi:multipass membrane protein [Candidatus Mancarchaeum acidiphilum]|uniref:Multipass membrane protein n=1 Tax=Candidatus Mancarchaeum acidiphilum TaxID=1920749 RepID=A0A218NMB9_9ARCH|nr:HPP family protein [Candidatus Mancarchaeum acidiphilum]ASI13615.1 multipass membrane protein [Candidatus Mancarchaeum acidiphilum]
MVQRARRKENSSKRLKRRLTPAVLAGATLAILVLLLEYFRIDLLYGIGTSAIIFTSFASSIFIMFITPNSRAAKAGKFVKSYLLAAIVGYIGGFATIILPLFVVAGIVIFVLIVLMILTYSEHPPAAAIAFAFVLSHIGLAGIAIIIIGIAIVLALRFFLEKSIFEFERKIEKIEKDL